MKHVRLVLPTLAVGVLLAGCHLDMVIQPKVKSQSQSDFFADEMGSRRPVAGTIQYGDSDRSAMPVYTGRDAQGALVREFPIKVDEALIKRGKDRFEAFCSHCHGAIGDGEGMIAQRGFKLARPVGNYHTDRLRKMPVGHFFDVITNGYGTMYPQASRVKPRDRWAIAAYIRVLQLSQNATQAELDDATLQKLGVTRSVPLGNGPLFTPPVAPTVQRPTPPAAVPATGGQR